MPYSPNLDTTLVQTADGVERVLFPVVDVGFRISGVGVGWCVQDINHEHTFTTSQLGYLHPVVVVRCPPVISAFRVQKLEPQVSALIQTIALLMY